MSNSQPPAPVPSDSPAPPEAEAAPAAPPAPLLTLRDGLPQITNTPEALAEVVARVAAGTGPIALDAERASGYRYSSRAYLIQLRREGSGSALIDPIAFPDLRELNEAFGDAEWILHAASQDLPCLREVGLRPASLFDTELAARLLGYPRVGLATLVETILGRTMRKEHSAVDWSKRPLPQPWLEYAALDVEVLLELREVIGSELVESHKDGWAEEEFTHLIDYVPPPRVDPWRRTSGLHKVKGRRSLAAIRELWQTRDALAQQRDTTPGRLIPDAAMVAVAKAMPNTKSALLETSGFHGRGAQRYADKWFAAIEHAKELPESELPPVASRSDGPPQQRVWADRDPVAAARLATARKAFTAFSEDRQVPVENMLTPDLMRRVLWKPPATEGPGVADAVGEDLRRLGAREWQIQLTAPLIAEAIVHPEPLPDSTSEPASADVSTT